MLKVLLHEMSWFEAKDYFAKNDLAIVPVGSNEEHGPANPLGTDHLIARRIAEETARRTGVLCLPVIPFGVSSHHKQFWGTIFISPEAFEKYFEDVCLSLKYFGVSKIVVVNGHGGNLNVLRQLGRRLRDQGIFMSIFQWWSAAEKLLPELFTVEERKHAAAEETSMNLALHSDLVNMDRAIDEVPRKHLTSAEGVTLPLYTVDETKSGIFGKASTASVKKGRKCFEAVVQELVNHVDSVRRARTNDLAQKPKV